MGLGTFSNQVNAIKLAERFAVLGAVDEEQVLVNGTPSTRLTLTYLKPGATKEDALALARELGLGDIILY
jgi:rare lipoprotein A